MLFTDIEGSTRMLRDLGARYAEVLADHRRLLRQAWEEHDGTEIDTQGDSFFIAFARATDAVAAAARGQRLLAEHPWPDEQPLRVRMGIHTGEPVLSAGSYVGIDVHRGARIAAAGHGGQVLVSRATVALLPSQLPDGVGLLELGAHPLKDLAEPELLFQLVIPGLERRFPELKTARRRETNLPNTLTPLLGRERELTDTRSILGRADVRLLTLTGPGGTGKTRLALELAATVADDFADGAFVVYLESIADPSLVFSAMARTLPFTARPVEPLDEWLAATLLEREMLILLDNFEQVVAAAPALAQLLARAPGPKLIVTSREPLRVAAEREYPVPPLGLPDHATSDPGAVAGTASVAFFLDRARAVRPDFELTAENAAAVADICTRLDGLPLAIELAAPWLRMLDPGALLSKLGERLDLLADRVRDLPERQRTLRGAIDWSYRLLEGPEQALFARLGIFTGGWTLEAAEAVCGRAANDSSLLLALSSLLDKNLVRREAEGTDDPRFSMLESVRTFALERLEASEDVAEVSERHLDFYVALAERAEPELFGPGQAVWMGRLSADLDNLRAAMTRAAAAPNGAEAELKLSGALMLFWFFLGQYREGLERAEQALARSADASPTVLVKGLLAAGVLASIVGDLDRAEQRLTQGLELGRELNDHVSAARCLDFLGLIAFFRDDVDEARRFLEESVAEAREGGDLWCLADALGTLGSILAVQGAFTLVEAAADEALEIARRASDDQGVRMALFGQALAAVRAGDLRRAREIAEEGLAISRSIGDAWFISYFLWILSMTAFETGDIGAARHAAQESLLIARRIEGPLLIVCALDALAATARAADDVATAAASLEEARTLSEGGAVPDSYVSSALRALAELAAERGDLTSAARELEIAVEKARGVGDPWGTARALLSLAQVMSPTDPEAAAELAAQALRHHADIGARLGVAECFEVCAWRAADRGELERAMTLMAAADALLDAAGAVRPIWRRRRCEETERAARAALADGAIRAAITNGSTETWQRMVVTALEGI